MKHIKTAIKIKLGRLGLSYCPKCGGDLWFDEDKWNMGYNVHSRCLHCDYLDRFDIPLTPSGEKVTSILWNPPLKDH